MVESEYNKVWVGHLTIYDAWTVFNTTVVKTLKYSTFVLILIELNLNRIMAPVGGRPNMGIYRTVKKFLVYARVTNQGLGINKLYTNNT